MGALTPSFLFDLESRMSRVIENEYARLSSNLFWSRLMKTRPSTSRRELITWFLSTAKIEDYEKTGGKAVFEDMVSTYTEFENKFAGSGLRLKKSQLEDTDGDGVDMAQQWSSDIGAYAAYWPQKKCVELLKNGHAGAFKSYDAVNFFSTGHPLNPFKLEYGYYANLFTGAAGAGGANANDQNKAIYPGAVVLDDSVSVDVALQNLSKAIAYIRSIKMPNGEDPRFLRPVGLMGGPRSLARVTQLTNAKFIAQAASSGGGSGDVEKLIASFGFTEPIIADEFANFESDTTHFLVCEQISASQLGGLVFVEREPFQTQFYNGSVDANLGRMNELEWQNQGRNVAGYGHPYLIFKMKAT